MKFNDYIKMLTESEKISKDPTYKEMKKFLDKFKKSYEADDFDVEAAIYWYASDNHSGQSSNLYSALSNSDYKPGRMESKPTGMAKEMYELLVGEFGGEPEESTESHDAVKLAKRIKKIVDTLNGVNEGNDIFDEYINYFKTKYTDPNNIIEKAIEYIEKKLGIVKGVMDK